MNQSATRPNHHTESPAASRTSSAATSANSTVTSRFLLSEHQATLQRFVDALEIRAAPGMKVFAEVRLAIRFKVSPRQDALSYPAVEADRLALRGSESHGKDLHSAISCHLSRFHGIRSYRVPAAGRAADDGCPDSATEPGARRAALRPGLDRLSLR